MAESPPSNAIVGRTDPAYVPPPTNPPTGDFPDVAAISFNQYDVGDPAYTNPNTPFPVNAILRAGSGAQTFVSSGELKMEVVSSPSAGGSRAAMVRPVPKISTDSPDMGGTLFERPSFDIVEGMEIWYKADIWLGSDYTPQTNAVPAKFMRIHREVAEFRSDAGALGFELDQNGNYYFNNASSTCTYPGAPPGCSPQEQNFYTVGGANAWTKQEWQTLEGYAYMTNGAGTVRYWRNGVLVYESDKIWTLPFNTNVKQLTDRVSSVQIWPYWNGKDTSGVTGTFPKWVQPCYVDNIVITSSYNPPPNTDAAGNPMIGSWTP